MKGFSKFAWALFLEVNQGNGPYLRVSVPTLQWFTSWLDDLLRNVSEHLSRNTNLDWAGVVVGLFSERLHLRPRDFEGSEAADAIKFLAAMRDQRVQIMAWYQELGNNITGALPDAGGIPIPSNNPQSIRGAPR